MAKVISPVWSTIRGSIAGITYTANQFGAIIARQKVSPVNPQSTNQTRVRGAFSEASTLFQLLTDDQRSRWRCYAKSLVYQGPTGQYTMPVRQVFISCIGYARYLISRNISLGTFGVDPPDNMGWLSIGNFTIEPLATPGTGFTLNVSNENPEAIKVVTKRSCAFGLTRNTYQGPFLTDSLTASDCPSSSTVQIEFTDLIEDSIYFVHIRAITSEPPYRISNDYIIRAQAETTEI